MKALGLLLLLISPSAAASTVSIQRAESGYRVLGAFSADVAPEVAWAVLTDYDGIGRFVSSIRSSRVVERSTAGPVIEQEGAGRFLFVSKTVQLRLAVRERAPVSLEFRDMGGGPFRVYAGSWRIEPVEGGCRVVYELTAEPEPSLGPRFAAKSALKSGARRLLDEVRAEMERRGKEEKNG